MANRRRPLKLVPALCARGPVARCRAIGCDLPGRGSGLGFCPACEQVYHAALKLRERLLEAWAARIAAAHPHLFGTMTPQHRDALLAHLAAHAQEARPPRGPGLAIAGLEDFLRELKEDAP